MAGKTGRGSKKNSKDNVKELFDVLDTFEKERGIPKTYMIEKITAAITVAVKNSNGGNDNVTVIFDPDTPAFEVFINKTVVEEVFDSDREILLDEAITKHRKSAQVGDVIGIRLDTHEFGRIAAMTAKHVIRQGIREAERGQVADEMRSKDQELVTATIERIDPRTGAVILSLSNKNNKIEVPLTKSEQVEGETYVEGETIKVFVVDIRNEERGPRVTVSRTHPGLVRRLFEIQVPEIADNIVEIKAIAREAGSRTKMAVSSNNSDTEPVGACIGVRHSRVNEIVSELGGEKIDIIKYSDDPAEFISNALAPAQVVGVEMDEENPKACRVRVPDSQLSLAIGHKGQNARLAARLTGYKIDIRPESGYYGEE